MWGATDYKLTADWLVEQQVDVQTDYAYAVYQL